MNAYDIIKKPVLSEKCYKGIGEKKYCFVVDNRANKCAIKAAVEQIFGVTVQKVNVVNVRGKFKAQGKSQGYTSKFKKAYVQLTSKSKAIEFFNSLT